MTKMFVANCTRQVQDFSYYLPESRAPRVQPIPVGGQIRISGELTPMDVEAIVKQHAKYGLVSAAEINRTKVFIGLCFSLDKPVPIDTMRQVLTSNVVVLRERGRIIREEAAVAVNNALSEENPSLTSLEMSVVEDRKDGGTPEVAEGVRVAHEAPGSTPPPEGRRAVGGKRGRG